MEKPLKITTPLAGASLAACVFVAAACSSPPPDLSCVPLEPVSSPTCVPLEPLSSTPPAVATGENYPGYCQDGWCWVAPTPIGVSLQDLWAGPGGQAWFVGEGGAVLHLEDGVLRVVISPVTVRLNGVWSTGTETWAVGDQGTVIHWNGATWDTQAVPGPARNLLDVHGSSNADVWVVAQGGHVYHWDGAAWSEVPSGRTEDLWSVWTAGPGSAWIVGGSPGLLRCEGSSCVLTPPPAGIGSGGASAVITDVQGMPWVKFDAGAAWAWNGTDWVEGAWGGVGGSGSTAFWVWDATDQWWGARYFFHGGSVSVLGHAGGSWAANSRELYGAARDDMYGIDGSGIIEHFDGTGWRKLPQDRAFPSLAGTAKTDRYGLRIIPGDGSQLWTVHLDTLVVDDNSAVGMSASAWTLPNGQLWMARTLAGFIHGIPSLTVSRITPEPQDMYVHDLTQTGEYTNIHGTNENNIWVAETNGIAHSTSEGWQWQDRETGSPYALWTNAPNDTWLSGSQSGLSYWDGHRWSDHPEVGFPVKALWSFGHEDVWASGVKDGTMIAAHHTCPSWTVYPMPTSSSGVPLQSFAGRCSNELFGLASTGEVFRWDGEQWSALPPIPFDGGGGWNNIAWVGDEIWVAGEGGRIVRRPQPIDH